jgi:hypothetical protein
MLARQHDITTENDDLSGMHVHERHHVRHNGARRASTPR